MYVFIYPSVCQTCNLVWLCLVLIVLVKSVDVTSISRVCQMLFVHLLNAATGLAHFSSFSYWIPHRLTRRCPLVYALDNKYHQLDPCGNENCRITPRPRSYKAPKRSSSVPLDWFQARKWRRPSKLFFGKIVPHMVLQGLFPFNSSGKVSTKA